MKHRLNKSPQMLNIPDGGVQLKTQMELLLQECRRINNAGVDRQSLLDHINARLREISLMNNDKAGTSRNKASEYLYFYFRELISLLRDLYKLHEVPKKSPLIRLFD